MAETTIQWADYTFNHVRGCTKVSPGCANCYADTMSKRNPGTLGVWGPNGTRVVAAESYWKQPLKWDREATKAGERRKVFCASLADIFEDWQGPMLDAKGNVLDSERSRPMTHATASSYDPITMQDVRARLFRLIDQTPNLDWLLLTKRPENIERMMPLAPCVVYRDRDEGRLRTEMPSGRNLPGAQRKLRENVWLGVSVEDRKHGLRRIDILRTIPAAVRFLSVEPLLEDLGQLDLTGIGWMIVGGESHKNLKQARPFNLDWARNLKRQCAAAGTAFFLKQVGSNPVFTAGGVDHSAREVYPTLWGPVRDSHGGNESEWPADLQGCREFPKGGD